MKMKRLCSVLLVLAMAVALIVVPASAADFSDVKTTDYFYPAVQWAVKNGITAGTSGTTFSPGDYCTRSQVMTFLWRSNSSPKEEFSNPFTDVRSTDWFYNPVMWAVSKGITAGTTANTFGPYDKCTRAQVMTFLWRNAGSPNTLGGQVFRDVAKDSYYYSAVQWAVARGITAGTGSNLFSPDKTCTRAEVVTFLFRYTGGKDIEQPANDHSAYNAVIDNTVKYLKKQSYDPNYVADNPHLKNAVGKADKVGYYLVDLDHDGSDELLIGDIGTLDRKTDIADRFYSYFWILYTIKDGYAVQVTQSYERERHYLGSDGNIYCVSSGGADLILAEKEVFKNGDLYVTECYFSDRDATTQAIKYCYSNLGEGILEKDETDLRRSDWTKADDSSLNEVQFNQRTNVWEGLAIKTPYVAITQYK